MGIQLTRTLILRLGNRFTVSGIFIFYLQSARDNWAGLSVVISPVL
jgi:hypothetical protein